MQAESWTSDARTAQLRVRRKRQARRRMVRRLGVAAVGLATVLLIAVAFVYAGSPNTLPAVSRSRASTSPASRPTEAVRRLESAGSEPSQRAADGRGRRPHVRGAAGRSRRWTSTGAPRSRKRRGRRTASGRFAACGGWPRGSSAPMSRRPPPSTHGASRTRARAHDDERRRLPRCRDPARRPAARWWCPSVPGSRSTRKLPRRRSSSTLASLDRTPVKLSTGTAEPKVTAEMLAPVAEKVRTAVSRPVKLVSGNGYTLVATGGSRAARPAVGRRADAADRRARAPTRTSPGSRRRSTRSRRTRTS